MPVSRKNPKRGKTKPTSQRSKENQRKARKSKTLANQPDIQEMFERTYGSLE